MGRMLSTAAKAAITLLLLALLFRKIDYSATLRHLRDITPLTAIAGVLILSAAVAIATARWSIVLRSMGRSCTGWNLFRFNLIGQFFNQALPSTIGGDGVRLWLLYQHGCTFAEAFNSVLIDRMAGFIVLALMSLYGLPTLTERMFAIPPAETITAVVVVSTALLLAFYGLARARTAIARFRAGRFVAQIVTDLMFLAGHPRDAANIAALSIGTQAAAFLLIWLILRDLGADVSIVGVMIVAPVVMLLLVLPVSIAGWGLREGLFVVGFGLLNVREDLALAASIVFGLINLAEGLIGGIFWLLQPARVREPITVEPAGDPGLIAESRLVVNPNLAEPPSEPA